MNGIHVNGVDWNTITTFGIYAHAGDVESTNRSPVANNLGVLIVFGYASTRFVQIDITTTGIAVRSYTDAWSSLMKASLNS
jgi:hypothetical protein